MQVSRTGHWLFCTSRGLGLILFFVYLILIPIQIHHDIIASMVVYCFGAVMLLLAISVLGAGLFMKNRLRVSIGAPSLNIEGQEILVSQRELLFSFTVTGAYIPPFTSLLCKISFNESVTTLLRLSNIGSRRSQTLFVPISFPHRGNWSLSSIEWNLIDDLGLWKWSRKESHYDSVQTIRLAPPASHTSGAPVINSCIRDGDELNDIQSAKGDLFDLKRYHPSDGMKKIVWKIYAKSGELLSRHPERTMTPEGKVLILVWADRIEDSPASLAIHYVRYLEEIGLDFAVVCRGMSNSAPSRTAESVESMLIDSTWNAGDSDLSSVQALLAKLLGQSTNTHTSSIETASHLVVIGDAMREANELESIGELISASNIQPVFIVAATHPRFSTNTPQSSAWRRWLSSLFITPDHTAESQSFDYKDFPRRAAFHHWDIHEVMP